MLDVTTSLLSTGKASLSPLTVSDVDIFFFLEIMAALCLFACTFDESLCPEGYYQVTSQSWQKKHLFLQPRLL